MFIKIRKIYLILYIAIALVGTIVIFGKQDNPQENITVKDIYNSGLSIDRSKEDCNDRILKLKKLSIGFNHPYIDSCLSCKKVATDYCKIGLKMLEELNEN